MGMPHHDKKAKIVIIDDEEEILKILKRVIEEKGYAVTTYASAVRALEQFKEDAPDLVLADIKMPKMDGIQLLSKVKKINPSVPVVLFTAFANIENAVLAMQQGAFDYIRKPFETKSLFAVIERALKVSKKKQ